MIEVVLRFDNGNEMKVALPTVPRIGERIATPALIRVIGVVYYTDVIIHVYVQPTDTFYDPVDPNLCFGSRRSEVRILSPRPSHGGVV